MKNRILILLATLGLVVTMRGQVTVGYRVDNDWGAGANVTFTITNATASAITNWTFEFDFQPTVFPYSWVGLSAHVGDHYVFTNLSYATLQANSSVSFQCSATPGNLSSNQPPDPVNYIFNGVALSGGSGGGVAITEVVQSGANLIINGSAGAANANGTYSVLVSANVALLPKSSWTVLAAGQALDANGNFSYTDTGGLNSGNPQQFYFITVP